MGILFCNWVGNGEGGFCFAQLPLSVAVGFFMLLLLVFFAVNFNSFLLLQINSVVNLLSAQIPAWEARMRESENKKKTFTENTLILPYFLFFLSLLLKQPTAVC